MTTLLPYQTTELSDEIDPCEKSRLDQVKTDWAAPRLRRSEERLPKSIAESVCAPSAEACREIGRLGRGIGQRMEPTAGVEPATY